MDLPWALSEMVRRGKQVPGGACGNWGACGAAISAGIFVSIATKSNPLTTEPWGLSNLMTSRSLASIAQTGGPRCCKRDSYKSILAAIDFAKEKLGISMTIPTRIICTRSAKNNQCLKTKCPFHQPAFKIPNI